MSLKIDKILVPTDFSEISLGALDYAAHIAKITKAQIILLHVLESYEHNNSNINPAFDYSEIIEKGIGQTIEDIKQNNIHLNGIKVVSKVVTGKIHNNINDVAVKEKVDLIVMGTRGSSSITDIKRIILGSNAYRTLEEAPCPVLTISNPKRNMHFKDIILPIDTSRETMQKVDLAIQWAKLFESRVHILAVMAFIDELSVDTKKMKKKVEDVSAKMEKAGVPFVSKLVRHQSISTSILDYAKRHNADMIMIVTGGSSLLADIVFRNDARTVVTASTVPVLSMSIK